VTIGIESWSLNVQDKAGVGTRTLTGRGTIPKSIPWDGRDDQGKVLPEGAYKAVLTIAYVNGNRPKLESPLHRAGPDPARRHGEGGTALFSPDGDGVKDTVTLTQQTSDEVFWTGNFTGADGRDVKTWIWRGRADPIVLWKAAVTTAP